MRLRNIIALLALVPAMAWAQSQQIELQRPPEADGSPTHSAHPTELIEEPSAGVLQRDSIAARRTDPVNPEILSKKDPVRSEAPNALTMQVIMAQKHTGISDEQWRKMMLEPVNASLYPIRITQAMLDTLDATQLDMRYRYERVKEGTRRP